MVTPEGMPWNKGGAAAGKYQLLLKLWTAGLLADIWRLFEYIEVKTEMKCLFQLLKQCLSRSRR